jgi:hypothetical protein
VQHGAIVEKRKKLVQFIYKFHMLFEGKPMSEYGNMGKFLLLFDVQNFPKIIGQIQQVGYG